MKVKSFFVKVVKKALPRGVKGRLKVLIASNPYILNPFYLFKKNTYLNELNSIVANHVNRKGIVVFAPTIDWNTSLYQRPHQLAKAFAREGYLVFFCTNNLSLDSVSGFNQIDKNLFLTNQTYVLSQSSEEVILIISWAINKFYFDRFKNAYKIYDYMDELDVFDGKDSDLKRDHQFLVSNCDLVVATADKLFKEIKSKSKKAILAPNGVDFCHFSREKYDIPADIAPLVREKKPIIGYFGAIAEWFDYELLIHLAKRNKGYIFFIIGPLDYDKSFRREKFSKLSNVYFVGSRKYSALPDYAHWFDLSIIPFKINDITDSTSPIKLFEYMAAGKPIITTAMPECKKYKSVLVSESYEEFNINLNRGLLLREDDQYLSLLEREANENSWASRVKKIEKSFSENS